MTLFFRNGMNPDDPIERSAHRRTGALTHHLVFLLFAPFLASIVAAWAWFNIGLPSHRRTDAPSTGILLTAATDIPGYTLMSETVNSGVTKTLGTTNILSGTFVRNQQTEAIQQAGARDQDSAVSTRALNVERSMLNVDRPTDLPSYRRTDFPPPASAARNSQPSTLDSQPPDRVTVFLATWSAGGRKPMTMIFHTPDICWRGSGWKPIDLGQPKRSSIQVGSENIGFETRIFESPDQREREAAVWCTLVGGKPFDELGTWRDEKAIRNGYANLVLNRVLRFKQMGRIIWERSPVRGSKQYVRFSTEMTDPWPVTLEKLRAFGSLWL